MPIWRLLALTVGLYFPMVSAGFAADSLSLKGLSNSSQANKYSLATNYLDTDQQSRWDSRMLTQNYSATEPATQKTSTMTTSGYRSWAPAHKYLGYGTILLSGISAVSSSDEDFHEAAAYATAVAALGTVLSGYMAHSDRFDPADGYFTKGNRHIWIGMLGAALLTTAVLIADDGEEGSHAALGISGGALMTLSVIDIKW